MKKVNILLLIGGGGSEHKVSLASGKEILNNLNLEKYEVEQMVMEDKDINIEKIKEINPDIVFIAIHGSVGEDGTLQKMLEDEKIRFTGSGSEASKIGMDKSIFKELMKTGALPIPKGIEIIKNEHLNLKKIKSLGKKWVVKPVSQGSSVGVSLVEELEKLDEAVKLAFEYDDRILIEEFIEGKEVSCGVLGIKDLMALPVIEICPKNRFFDYEAKYTSDKCEEIVPARLLDEVTKKVQDLSIQVFKLVGARGFARIDFIIKNNQPIILEINTIPGLTSNSLLPKEAAALGINYSQLLDRIIKLALE